MADKLIPATPQDVQEKAPPLTPEQKRRNAAALAKQQANEKRPINPDVSQEPSKSASKPFAKGGRVTRGDGCAQRGHTKGKNL
jgi:hypothetical protein